MKVFALPAARSDLIKLLEVAPGAVLADNLAHAQHRGSDRVEALGVGGDFFLTHWVSA